MKDKFRYPLKTLAVDLGSDTYISDLFYPKEEVETYSRDKIFLGWERKYEFVEASMRSFWHPVDKEKKKLYLDSRQAFRALELGMTGSGKTFLLESILSRAHVSGYACIHLSDVKNELRMAHHPLQEKFAEFLQKREKPEGIRFQMMIPAFLKGFYRKLPENARIVQFNFSELSESDWATLFEVENDVTKVDIVRTIAKLVDDGKVETWDDMLGYLTGEGEYNPFKDVTAASLKYFVRKVKLLRKFEILDTVYNQDLIEMINNGYSLSLGLKEYDRIAKSYPQSYVSILIEKIRRAKRNGEIKKPIIFFVDEAHVFVPKNSNPSCKEKIKTVINLDRYYDISMIFSTQYPRQLPEEDVLRQMKYYFVPYNIDKEVFLSLLKMVGIYRRQDQYTDRWLKLLEKMRKHEWLFIEREGKRESSVHIFKPAAPLFRHIEQRSYGYS